jgi:4-hydroxythreonine-4-phosphate dehydrogenase
MFLAVDIFKNRKIYAEISKNPLKTYNINPNQVDESVNLEEEDDHL